MNFLAQAQEQARRFNEAEAVLREFERRRALRRLFPKEHVLDEQMLDELDWQAAVRRRKKTQALGLFIS
jgi:hypothetical protein